MSAAPSELALPGLWPVCPDCNDLSHPGASVCESCGSPLLLQRPYRERTERLRDELGRWIGDQ
jgi:hypothetical protein